MKKEATKEELKEFKKAYNRLSKLATDYKEAVLLFDDIAKKHYQFTHSDTDDDEMIDTLEYGISSLSFEGYVSKMNQYEKEMFPNLETNL